MKPIAIFRHSASEGPGYFATFLERHSVPWEMVCLDAGEAVPADVAQLSGLCLMGGPMSVNDSLSWIPPVLELIREAVRNAVPVVGHCLGGQLMAKALGAEVRRNAVKEIGWGDVAVEPGPKSLEWLGSIASFEGFHWHGETFDMPEGAVRLMSSRYCANQAFVLGRHLGLQCHVEMTEELIRRWCEDWDRELRGARSPSVQTPDEMLRDLPIRLDRLHRVADSLYTRWLEGVARD